MNAYRSRILGVVVVIIMMLAAAISSAAITAKRVSNPGLVSGMADGLVPGGDRYNNYAWAMETLSQPDGDYLYVGSNRNFAYSILAGYFVNNTDMKTPAQFNPLITEFSQGDIGIPPAPVDNQGRVFRYKIDGSGPWEIVHKGDYAYRGAVNFTDSLGGNALYMVTTSNPGHVLKFPADFNPAQNDVPQVVFRIQTPPGVGIPGEGPLRSMTVHNNELFIGMFTNNIFKTNLPVQQAAGNGTATDGWTQVASAANFPADKVIWQILSYNNYLYAFLAGTKGFAVYKGAQGSGNGWEWQEIVGDTGRYPAGIGDPYNSSTATKVFKGHVYVGTMTQMHLSFLAGTFSSDQIKGGQIYRFDTNDNWELIIGDPDRDTVFSSRKGNYGAGFYNISWRQWILPAPYNNANLSFNQYIWWMEEYEGKLYASTFDISVFLQYLTPESMSMLGMSPSDITKITQALDMLEQIKENPAGFDLYVSSDGVNWSSVTINGFSDQFNYGGRVLKSTEQGLFVGTANPFYGCQVWKVNDDQKTGGGDSGGGGCFIATAAFGSPLTGQVMVLREFRDRYLLTNPAGRAFVAWYYAVSPAASEWIAERPLARVMVRTALYPVIGVALAANNAPYLLLLLMISLILATTWFVFRRISVRSLKIK